MSRICSFFAALLVCFSMQAQSFFPVKLDKKWGLINAEGKVVVPARYDAIGEFKQFGYAVMQRDGGVGLLGAGGKEVVNPIYDDLKVLDSTLIAVMSQSEWMVINLRGETVLEKGYQQVKVWNSFYLAYLKDGKWGLNDKYGQKLCPPIYDELQFESGNFFITSSGNHMGLLSSIGRTIIAPAVDEIRFFNDSLYFYKKDQYWGAVNFYGIEVIPPKYKGFSKISDNFIKLSLNEGQFIYSIPCSRIISDGSFDNYYPFSKRYVIAKKNRQMGLLDWCGNLILPAQFDEIQAFQGNYFRVNYQGHWGIVEKGGKKILPLEYQYISPLRDKIAVVKKDGFYGIINFKGELELSPSYYRLELQNNSQAKAYSGSGSQLTLLSFDEEGHFLNSDQFNQHFKITITGKKAEVPQSNSNEYQLEQFEWFYAPLNDRWGLRRLSDGEVQIEPAFHSVKVVPGSGFTQVGIEKSGRYEFERTTFRFDMVYGLVNNDLGLLVTEMDFWDISLESFQEGVPLAKCLFSNGRFGLIDRIGKVVKRDLAYVGDFVDGVARFSFVGQLSGSMNTERALGKLNSFLNDIESPSTMVDYTLYDQHFKQDAFLTCQDCEWGYIDTNIQVVVTPQFSFAKDFINKVGIVECNGKWGMVNQKNKVVIPCNYDGVQFLDNTDNRIVKVYIEQPKYGLIDTLGQITVNAIYDEIGSFSDGRLAVQKNGLWGFVNDEGLEVIPCRFREVRNFSEGLTAVRLGSEWGYIDRQGHIEIPIRYKKAGNFRNGLAWVITDAGVGYIDKTGELAIKSRFDRAFDFHKNAARVVLENQFALIDQSGKTLTKSKYTDIGSFNEHDLAIVSYGNNAVNYGLLNIYGELITTLPFREIGEFHEGLAAVKYKDGYGFIDTTGKLVIPSIYTKVSNFSEGLAAVQKDGTCGYIDYAGQTVVPLDYSKCLDFNEGRAVVYKGIKKAGLIDKEGKLLIEPSLDRLLTFQEGRGLVRDEKYRFYYITEQASLYNGYYQEASEFKYGVAVVQIDGRWGIINRKGIEVIPPKYDKIESFKNGFAKVRIQGFSGLASLNGDLIITPDYEYISYAGAGLFRVEKGDKIGYFDINGEWVWDMND
ncbi:MAG TPA: WG repeat-containing protein [Saprospiraceae bacterium]|nr:WG repeat-containing protein [Saprospiraceae bacterium]HMQ82105.1 WG repeat-containing protein [Saprospiraceae bacterium]